jgi:hypothetical protein
VPDQTDFVENADTTVSAAQAGMREHLSADARAMRQLVR